MHKTAKRLVIAAAVFAAIIAANLTYTLLQQKNVIRELKKFVSRDLKDPESVKYRNIKLRKYAPTLYEKLQFITSPNKDHPDVLGRIRRAVTYTLPYELCGEINARNSFGAYDGYKLFFAKLDETSTVFIDAEPDDDAAKIFCDIDIPIVYQEQ